MEMWDLCEAWLARPVWGVLAPLGGIGVLKRAVVGFRDILRSVYGFGALVQPCLVCDGGDDLER